jgi:glycosyltransferase involved in cell wall biosynthesis
MKVVHLNTYDGNGGAGRAVLRLNKGLQLSGIDSDVVCLYQFNSNSGVKAISQTLFGKFRSIVNILFERFLIKPFLKTSAIPFSLQRFGVSLDSLNTIQEADIIHLHWINHGFLSAKEIASLAILNKKIVFTTHDSNPVTGGCHVRYNCTNYVKECGECPVLKNPSENDLSHRTWQLKKQAYQQVNFDFIAPSTWMSERVKEASLAAEKKVHMISNGLETDLFHPLDKLECRKAYDVDEQNIVILAGYMPSQSDRHKGFPELIQTINHLAADPRIDKENLLLLFYGNKGENIDLKIPIKHRFLGQINNDDELVKLYSLADVFLFTSLEESMGYTALESIACGTPVVAFSTSGVTDVVVHRQHGFLAELYDTRGLAEGVNWVLENRDTAGLSQSARKWAVSNFSLNVIAQKHIQLYQSLLNQSHV